jgi:membrane protein
MDAAKHRREAAERSLFDALVSAAIRAEIDLQAAQIAFNAVFSLGPILGLTTAALSLVPGPHLRDGFRAHVLPFTPAAVRPWLDSQLHRVIEAPNPLLLAGSIAVLLWSVSSTTGAIAAALGHVGWRLRPTWLSRKLSALGLGLGLVSALVLAAIGATLGPRVIAWVARFVPHASRSMAVLWWLRWPVVGVVFGLVAALTFWFATSERPRWYAAILGGMTAGIVNVTASSLLSFYLAIAPSMGAWGAAAGMFATLLWLWLLALGLLVGAVVAFVLDARWRARTHAASPRFPLRRSQGHGSARRARRGRRGGGGA